MSTELPFNPFPFLVGSHRQTILGSFFTWKRGVRSKTHLVDLPDKDQLAIEVAIPKKWKEKDPVVVMVHGLCGSHNSPYLVRLSKKLYKTGVASVRVNLRGCGSGRGRAKQIYHSGRSEDVLEVLKYIKELMPSSPVTLMGFSMGGNIVLKLAGELGPLGREYLSRVISLSPPTDLYASIQLLGTEQNRFYERYFLRLLKATVRYREKKFPDVPRIDFPRDMNLMVFDEIYTAPQGGFKSAMDYYERASSVWVIPEIEIPCYILFAEDDPIISSTSLDGIKLPQNIQVFKTKHGGHLGFLGSPLKGRFHWMDEVLLKWALEND